MIKYTKMSPLALRQNSLQILRELVKARKFEELTELWDNQSPIFVHPNDHQGHRENCYSNGASYYSCMCPNILQLLDEEFDNIKDNEFPKYLALVCVILDKNSDLLSFGNSVWSYQMGGGSMYRSKPFSIVRDSENFKKLATILVKNYNVKVDHFSETLKFKHTSVHGCRNRYLIQSPVTTGPYYINTQGGGDHSYTYIRTYLPFISYITDEIASSKDEKIATLTTEKVDQDNTVDKYSSTICELTTTICEVTTYNEQLKKEREDLFLQNHNLIVENDQLVTENNYLLDTIEILRNRLSVQMSDISDKEEKIKRIKLELKTLVDSRAHQLSLDQHKYSITLVKNIYKWVLCIFVFFYCLMVSFVKNVYY